MISTRKSTTAAALLAVAALGVAAVSAGAAAGQRDRIIGGGWFAVEDPNIRVTFGTELTCPATEADSGREPDLPGREDDNLAIHWDGNEFQLEQVLTSECTIEDPNIRDGGGTHEGTGSGRCNGEPASVRWTLHDGGVEDPNLRDPDTAEFEIRGTGEGCALSFGRPLEGGDLTFIDNPNI